jgi:hypothetical protein
MRRFTVFTLLYLAGGICLTTIALQFPHIALRPKTILLLNAGLLYLFAVFTTYPFWRQAALRQNRNDRPIWRQKFGSIAPWLMIAASLFSFIVTVLTEHWTNFAIGQAATMLTIILLCVEQILVRNQSL